MENLKIHISKITDLSDIEWQAFNNILEIVKIPKGDLFLRAGQICDSSAFIDKGLLKVFTTDSQGNDKIIQFNMENSFLSDCESYIQKKPSVYTIKALENAELIVFKNSALEHLCEKFPVFDKIGKQVTTEILSYYKEHINLLMDKSPQERYVYLVENKPELIQRISVTNLSQYLGLTRETVSRIRRKIMS